MKKKQIIFLVVVSLLLITGCAPGLKYFDQQNTGAGSRASFVKYLPIDRTGDPGKVDSLKKNVGILASQYFESYNKYQEANLGANGMLLGIGLTAAGFAAFDPSIDLIKSLAIGAGATAAVQNFTITGKPDVFLKAHNSLVCVQDALGELDELSITLPQGTPLTYAFADRVNSLKDSDNPDIRKVYQSGQESNGVLQNLPTKILLTVDKIVSKSMNEFWTSTSIENILNDAKTDMETAITRNIESKKSFEDANFTFKHLDLNNNGMGSFIANFTRDTVEEARIVNAEIKLITNYQVKLSSCLIE